MRHLYFSPRGIFTPDLRVCRSGVRHRGADGHDALLRGATAQGARREQRGGRGAEGPADNHRAVGRAQPGCQDLHAHLFGKCDHGCCFGALFVCPPLQRICVQLPVTMVLVNPCVLFIVPAHRAAPLGLVRPSRYVDYA